MQPTFEQQLHWINLQTPYLKQALTELPPLHGMRLACSMHLDHKMIPLVEGLLARGAELFLTTCSPATVRDEVVEHLRKQGAAATAWKDMPAEAYQAAINEALDWQPTHLCEMGADLTTALLKRPPPEQPQIKASLEATGSGINRLQNITPPYPIFNWDDLPVKEGLHNRHMVGLTTWHTFFARTQLTLHGKRVVVVGYGSVGRGVAAAARAFGGMVTVAELDPARALEAQYDGWHVQPLAAALPHAEVVVTATGTDGVISMAQMAQLPHGAFLLNVGHQAAEIDVAALRQQPHKTVLPFVEAFQLESGRTVYLFARGALANLTAGNGDSINAFDVTLAVMSMGIKHIIGVGATEPPGVYLLPRPVWQAAVPMG